MWANGMMSGAGWGMDLYMAAFWILVLAAFAVLVTGFARRNGAGRVEMRHPRSARAILEERYVRGEINRAEFEQKKRDLSH